MVHQGKAEGMQMSEGQSDLPAAELDHLAAEVFLLLHVLKVGSRDPWGSTCKEIRMLMCDSTSRESIGAYVHERHLLSPVWSYGLSHLPPISIQSVIHRSLTRPQGYTSFHYPQVVLLFTRKCLRYMGKLGSIPRLFWLLIPGLPLFPSCRPRLQVLALFSRSRSIKRESSS